MTLPSAEGGSMQYRRDIDGLRAIAVMGVMLFHFSIGHVPGGFTGVDVFFVISGFLITQVILKNLEDGEFSFRSFYLRRFRRLLPAFFATLLLSLVAGALLFSAEQMTRFGVSISAATFSVSNILFWSEHGYFDVASHLKPLLHTWSLSVEEQFYLVWPITLVWLTRYGRRAVVAGLLVVFVASLGSNLLLQPYQSALFYLSPFRFFEFVIGAAVIFVPRRASNLTKEIANLAGLALIAGAYHAYTDTMLFPSYPALVPTVGAALVLWGGTARWSGLLLRNPVAVGVGLISYSLYLVHWPIIVFWDYAHPAPLLPREKLALLGLTFVLATLMYFCIERPFRARTRSSFRLLPRSFPAVIAVAAMLMAGLGLQIWTSYGWLWRLGDRGAVLYEFVAGDRQVDALYGGDGCKAPCTTLKQDRAPDVIFIGASHSRQYFLGAKTELSGLKVDFHEYSSCQFYSVEYTRDYTGFPDPTMYDAGCRAARKGAFEAIRKAPNALIVLSEFWGPMAMQSEKAGASLPVPSPEEYYKFVGFEIDRLKSELGVKRLAVIGSVPTAAGVASSLDCFGRPVLTEKACATKPLTDPIIAQRAETNALLSANLPSDPAFLNPFDALCNGQTCAVVGAGPVYSDATHLSGLGSKMAMAAIAPALRAMLVPRWGKL